MARMIPDLDPAMIGNSGERAAYRELARQLPTSWVVRYHYPFCWSDGRRLKDGEADFIVVAPGRGILVIEVKGSHGFDCIDGQWHRVKDDGSKETADNPFEQATNVKHRLVKRIAEKAFHARKDQFPGVYGHIVMYPHGKIEGSLPSSSEPVLMVSHRDMNNLYRRLEGAFEAWGGHPLYPVLPPDGMQKIVHFLSDATKGVPVFAAKSDEDDQTIEELTQLQFRAFKGLLGGKRIHVTGPAGSGKTLLARWTAQLLADRGEKVLLTCFNRTLAEWLRGLQKNEKPVQVESFFSLCRRIVMQAGLPWNPPPSGKAKHDFWTRIAPALFDEALSKLPPENLERYDGIIVDEGQDFHPDWWIPLMLLLKDPDGGRLCIFSDGDQQGVYGRGESYPSGLFPYELEENCRNTRRIAGYCGNIIRRKVLTTFLQPEGSHPTVSAPGASPRERAKIVKSLVSALVSMGYSPSQVAILSMRRLGHEESSLAFLQHVCGIATRGSSSDVQDWEDGHCFWASTVKAFKGLEAQCVIVTDVEFDGSIEHSIADLYIGATRAKHQLRIIPCSSTDQSKLETFLQTKTRLEL